MIVLEYLIKLIIVLIFTDKFKKYLKKKLNFNKKNNYKIKLQQNNIKLNFLKILNESLKVNYEIKYIIVSSNYSLNLKNEWEEPTLFIEFLINNFPDIIFLFPTNPILSIYSKKKYFKKPMFNDYYFDKKQSRISTGLVGTAAIKMKDSIRSSIPINNLTAVGSKSKMLNKFENLEKIEFAMDENTWWGQLNENTLWVGLDVDVANSFTPIHIIEDQKKYQSNFTNNNWYFNGNFTTDINIKYDVKIRNPLTSISYLPINFNKYLYRNKLVKHHMAGSLKVSIININQTINFLQNKCYSPFKFISITKILIKCFSK